MYYLTIRQRLIFLLLALLGCSLTSNAQQVNWTGNTSSDWNTSTNWFPQVVPNGDTFAATIPVNTNGNPQPIITGTVNVGPLEEDMETATLSFENLHTHGELFANLFRARRQSFIVQNK
ncbi:MAG: hypothetical protein AAGA62_13450, partial [Bacteroidota bacterium]